MTGRGIYNLTGRVALITGGSRGIGRIYAEADELAGIDVLLASDAFNYITGQVIA